jgi:hypothetical protein
VNEQEGERLRHGKRIDRGLSPCLPWEGHTSGRSTPDSEMWRPRKIDRPGFQPSG